MNKRTQTKPLPIPDNLVRDFQPPGVYVTHKGERGIFAHRLTTQNVDLPEEEGTWLTCYGPIGSELRQERSFHPRNVTPATPRQIRAVGRTP